MPSPLPTLVLLPGMDGTGALFKYFIPQSPFDHVVVSYPASIPLGYASLQKIVEEKIAGLPRFILLAESFSGPIAVKIAATNPSGMAGLILCASFISPPLPPGLAAMAGIIAQLARHAPDAALRFLLAHKKSGMAQLKEVLGQIPPAVIAARIREALSTDVSSSLKHIKAPILYIRAQQDRCVGEKSLKEVLALRPDTLVTRINGPHLLLQTRPREAIDAVREFAEQLPAPSSCHPRA